MQTVRLALPPLPDKPRYTGSETILARYPWWGLPASAPTKSRCHWCGEEEFQIPLAVAHWTHHCSRCHRDTRVSVEATFVVSVSPAHGQGDTP